MKILLIIVTYNGANWIDECLQSILKSYILPDIFIIDNNSTDDTIAHLKKHYLSKIILHESPVNLGFGKGNNIGLQFALQNNYQYVFLMNQDAFLEINTLGELIAISEKNRSYGILSPIHLNKQGEKLETYFAGFVDYIKNPHFYSDFIIGKSIKSIYDFEFISAAAWLLPLDTIRKIGGFDPIFWHYGEDDNYCQRVLFHNLKIGVVTKSFIRHDSKIRVYNKQYIYTERFFQDYTKDLQVKFANVNYTPTVNIFWFQTKILIKDLLSSVVTFDYKKLKSTIRKFGSSRKIFCEISKSKKINCKIGAHYLDR